MPASSIDAGHEASSQYEISLTVQGSEHATANAYLKSWSLAIVTLSLCLGTFLVALDVNIIGVAVPKISAVFESLDDIAWYGSAYLLTLTAFQPTIGYVYKYFNVRATYLCSIFVFEGKYLGLLYPAE